MSTTFTSNSYHSKHVWFINLLIFISIYDFRKIFIILINDSNDSNLSSKFTVLVIVAFQKKKR